MNKINDGLLKAFDSIMEQQKKMDDKAYIFIGLLILIFSFVNKDWDNIRTITWLLVIIAVPLILSLIPIANPLAVKLLSIIINGKKLDDINIFYYFDLYKLEMKDFIESFKKEYDEQTISRYDEKLIEQILVNAKILKVKVFWHNISQLLMVISLVILIILKMYQVKI